MAWGQPFDALSVTLRACRDPGYSLEWWAHVLRMHVCSATQSCLTFWDPVEPPRLLCPWDSPGKNTGVDCHALLQGIFLTQGWNLRPPPLAGGKPHPKGDLEDNPTTVILVLF